MKYGWIKLLLDNGVDITTGGGADFAELVLRLINGFRWSGSMPSVGEVARAMAKERGCSTEPMYREMKAAIAPLRAALAAEGIHEKELKTTVIAVKIAEMVCDLMQEQQEQQPDKSRIARAWKGKKKGVKSYPVEWQGR